MSEIAFIPRVPRLHDDAARIIRAVTTCYGPQFEYGFRAEWDHAAHVIHSPVFFVRGNRRGVMLHARGMRAGSMLVHTHPVTSPTEPSDADLQVAESFVWAGLGFAVTNSMASELFVVTLPECVEPASRSSSWRLGRLSLTWAPASARTR